MSTFEVLTGAFISAVFAYVLGTVSPKFLRKLMYLRPAKKLLGSLADDNQELKIVIGTFQIPPRSSIREKFSNFEAVELTNIPEITSVSSAYCASFILTFLASMRSYENIETIDSAKFSPEHYDSNIMTIGGPMTNIVTKKILEYQEDWLPYEFTKLPSGEVIIEKTDRKKTWHITPRKDYGVIIKAKNPFSLNKSIFIFAGLSGDASVGSAYFFQSRFKELVRKYGRNSFGVIIEVDREIGYRSAQSVDFAGIA
jgi:hypothetical protein